MSLVGKHTFSKLKTAMQEDRYIMASIWRAKLVYLFWLVNVCCIFIFILIFCSMVSLHNLNCITHLLISTHCHININVIEVAVR